MVINAPVWHLSGGKVDDNFRIAADWLFEKWGEKANYMIPTCALVIYRINPTNILKAIRTKINRRLSSCEYLSRCSCNEIIVNDENG